MKRRIAMAAGVVMFAMAHAASASASRPVPKIVTACVAKGELTLGRYTYSVRRGTPNGLAGVDLAPYEGRRIRVEGYLLPGDILVARSIRPMPGACSAKP